ncbi:hypothetical protein ACFL6P_03370 [Candidatus Latescibacterota bacterium]
MATLSLKSLQTSLASLFNVASYGTTSSISGNKIWDIITDQYLASSYRIDLSGLYDEHGISIRKILEDQEPPDIYDLLSSSLDSQHESYIPIISDDSELNENDDYKHLFALNRAKIANYLVLFGKQDSLKGDILNLYN